MNETARQAYEREYADHLQTWGPHCGAPKSVFKGHLDVLLAACRAAIVEELNKTPIPQAESGLDCVEKSNPAVDSGKSETQPTRRLRLKRMVVSDIPIGPRFIAVARVYEPDEIQVNPHGAISVKTPEGYLGIKPDEFEWLPESKA